jgi:hypothetical protein
LSNSFLRSARFAHLGGGAAAVATGLVTEAPAAEVDDLTAAPSTAAPAAIVAALRASPLVVVELASSCSWTFRFLMPFKSPV